MKLIFVSGGVVSGLGKGISAASIGLLLKKHDNNISFLKCDPYINVDAGTMNPVEHGEVFVTDDGYEMDMDGGHYERFIDIKLSSDNTMTTGQIYLKVIQNERKLKYDGACVEVIPHVRNEIISRIEKEAQKCDILVIEIGGTVGEYQNDIYYDAERVLKRKLKDDLLHIHITYLPIPKSIGEMKTKPTQQSVLLLNERGILPDIIIGRSEAEMDSVRRKKVAISTAVDEDAVFSNTDTDSIYKVPLQFFEQKLDKKILSLLNLPYKKIDFKDWQNFCFTIDKKYKEEVNIGLVGKYQKSDEFSMVDSYVSVVESLKISAWNKRAKLNIVWIDAEDKVNGNLKYCDGIIIPGGFGKRGLDGKINAISFVRENNIPYLGLCLGMQIAAIEFARNIAKIKDANSFEMDPDTQDPVIYIMPDQVGIIENNNYGGSMRLGKYRCVLNHQSKSYTAYEKDEIEERHRHRYEFNNKYREQFENLGMLFSGLSPDNKLVEIIEIPSHPFFVGVQFHPEFKSRPLNPHPLFNSFIAAALKKKYGSI